MLGLQSQTNELDHEIEKLNKTLAQEKLLVKQLIIDFPVVAGVLDHPITLVSKNTIFDQNILGGRFQIVAEYPISSSPLSILIPHLMVFPVQWSQGIICSARRIKGMLVVTAIVTSEELAAIESVNSICSTSLGDLRTKYGETVSNPLARGIFDLTQFEQHLEQNKPKRSNGMLADATNSEILRKIR